MNTFPGEPADAPSPPGRPGGRRPAGRRASARADFLFDVSLDTSSLVANPANGPYSIDFTLIDGSGTNDGNNSVLIGGFTYGGGNPTGSPSTTGSASGSLGLGSVALSDQSFFNDFNQTFNPGGMLTFQVSLTTNVEATPDTFAFAILDGTGATLATNDPLGGDALFRVTFDGNPPTIDTYSGLVGPPTISPRSVPEPSAMALLALGVALAGWRLRRR